MKPAAIGSDRAPCTRAALEEREAAVLAPFAARAGGSRGRRHPEEEDSYRTAFQRDRDRVIHSTAFRRLEYKTQVFINHEGDHYRTRLTHTIEVAQIARAVARALRLNEDLAEVVSLAHDLGHPPFGHAGERALQACMEGQGGFEHNVQALRVVDLLERRYPDRPGLNLSFEVRESILKHSTFYDSPEISAEFGATPRPLLEAQVADIADMVAYNNHDLDDGLYSGLLSEEELLEVPLFAVVRRRVLDRWPDLDAKLRRRRIVAALIAESVTDLVSESSRRIAVAFLDSAEAARSHEERLIAFSSEMWKRQKQLASFLAERLYAHHRVVRMAVKAEGFVRRMFEAYLEDPRQLPPEHHDRIPRDGVHRAVCDYIAGMTDRYAQDGYMKMFHPFERI